MAFNESEFREAMSQFATGVVVVSGNENGSLVGFAAQSFVSLSLDPPLVLFCPQKISTSWPKVRKLSRYSVNILNSNHSEMSEDFAIPGNVPNVQWVPWNDTQVPKFLDSLMAVELALESEYVAGDHTIVVSSVRDVYTNASQRSPLLFFRGEYGFFKQKETLISK